MSRAKGLLSPLIERFAGAIRAEALWPGAVLVTGGAAGTLAGHATATWTGPSSGTAVVVTVAVVAASLVAIGVGAEIVVTAARSPMRHVFVSDALRRMTVPLVALATGLLASVVLLDCFSDLFVDARLTASVVAGVGMVGAAVALVVVVLFARWLAAESGRSEQGEL